MVYSDYPVSWKNLSRILIHLAKRNSPWKLAKMINVPRRLSYRVHGKIFKVFEHFDNIINPIDHTLYRIADAALLDDRPYEIYQRLLDYIAGSNKIPWYVREAAGLIMRTINILRYVDINTACILTEHLLKVEQNQNEKEKLHVIYTLAVTGRPVTYKIVRHVLTSDNPVVIAIINAYAHGMDVDLSKEFKKTLEGSIEKTIDILKTEEKRISIHNMIYSGIEQEFHAESFS